MVGELTFSASWEGANKALSWRGVEGWGGDEAHTYEVNVVPHALASLGRLNFSERLGL